MVRTWALTARQALGACMTPGVLLSNLHICICDRSLLIRTVFGAHAPLRCASWQPWAALVLTSEYCARKG